MTRSDRHRIEEARTGRDQPRAAATTLGSSPDAEPGGSTPRGTKPGFKLVKRGTRRTDRRPGGGCF